MAHPSQRQRRLAAAVVAGLTVALAVASFVVQISQLGTDALSGIPLGVAIASFGLVGAVIIARVPGNRLGWVFANSVLALEIDHISGASPSCSIIG